MQRRRGFTITELLVAMALMMFIMAVLAEAFHAGLESFRQLKSVGDMDQRLRTAASLLRRDLDANVLQVSRNNHKRVSELTTQSPTSGFFAIGESTGGGQVQTIADVTPASPQPPPYVYQIIFSSMSHQDALQPPTPPPPPVRLTGQYGSPSAWVTVKSFSGNTLIVTSQDPLPSPLGQFLFAQWDVPNGFYDELNGPNTTGLYGDADGLLSPFATSYKLYFTIDLGAPPKSGGPPPRRRRENHIAVPAPQAIQPQASGTAYSPLLFQNDIGTTLVGQTPPALNAPFEDPQNHLTQTAEVAYFLKDGGTTTPNGQIKLYTLYRRELALAPSTKTDSMNKKVKGNPKNQLPRPVGQADYWASYYHSFSGIPDPSAIPPKSAMRFNTHDDVSLPANRCFTYTALNAGPYPLQETPQYAWSKPLPQTGGFPVIGDRGEPDSLVGSDILLTDVISFSVRLLPNPLPVRIPGSSSVDTFVFPGATYEDAADKPWNDAHPNGPKKYHWMFGGYDTAYTAGFDSWNNPSSGQEPNIKFATNIQALEILIRVYDQKTQRARQITILQAM